MSIQPDDHPAQLLPRTETTMDRPVTIHTGEFVLKGENAEIPLTGTVYFKWFPSHGTAFEGNSGEPIRLRKEHNFDLYIGEENLGSCFLTNVSGEQHFRGVFKSSCITGEQNIAVESIEFEIFNLRDFTGHGVRKGPKSYANNLLTLEDDRHMVMLFKHIDHENERKALRWQGSYQALYSGRLNYKNPRQPLTFENSRDTFDALSLFLTFLNGRRCSPIFRKGMFGEETTWTDYTPYHTDKQKAVHSWPPYQPQFDYSKLWQRFLELHKDPDEKEVLNTLVHSYIRANGHVFLPFEGISLTANALELLFNYLIVEKKKIIAGKDVENLQASNKIRLVLSQLGLENHIPDSFSAIRNCKNSIPEFRGADAPELFTQIRNIIVHGQFEKRKKLAAIPADVLWEMLSLSIWYVELSILYVLDYQGSYRNRTLDVQYVGEGEENVPWYRER